MNKSLRYIIISSVLLGVLAVLPVILSMEQYQTPSDAPGHLEGSYIDLPSGRTHYVRAGTGPTIFLIAGLTGNYTVWDRTFRYLSKHFTTVAYDNYGRGFSERRDTYLYDRDLYRTQLTEMMSALEVTQAGIVGTSMGGAIALDFAAANPTAVSALVLVDNAGLPFETPAVKQLTEIPYLGEYLISVLMRLIMHQGFERGFYRSDIADERFRHRYMYTATIRGFERALLESIRTMPLHDLESEILTVAETDIPTMIVWGKEDNIVPFEVFGMMTERMPNAKSIVIHDSGHMPHAERPEIFGPNVAAFLNKSLLVANSIND